MHERREAFRDSDAGVVFVAFDGPEALREGLLDGVELAFPFIADAERETYRAWGLRRGSAADIWLDPKVWLQYGKLLLGGERIRAGGADTLQFGGDFVIDPEGVVRYSRPQERDDRPPVGELLAAVREAR